MPSPGYYDHLNDSNPITTTIPMERLVSLVGKSNYGVHRFLSELLRQRREKEVDASYLKPYNDTLEKLLLDGFF